MMRRRISRAQQTKNWCVGFSFPPPAYAGIHPTLYLFGFRADALNSHSPPYLPGFDPRSCLERFDTLSGSSGKVVGFSCRGLRSSETVRGPPGPPGGFRGPLVPSFSASQAGASAACRGLRGPPGASEGLRASEACGGLDVGFGSGFRVFLGLPPYPCLADPEISAPPGRPRTPPRTPLGRFPGRSRTPGPWRASRKPENPGLQVCEAWTLGLVAGFASFWAPSLAGPKLSAFPSHFQGGLAGSGLMPPQQNAEGQGR